MGLIYFEDSISFSEPSRNRLTANRKATAVELKVAAAYATADFAKCDHRKPRTGTAVDLDAPITCSGERVSIAQAVLLHTKGNAGLAGSKKTTTVC